MDLLQFHLNKKKMKIERQPQNLAQTTKNIIIYYIHSFGKKKKNVK